MKPSFRLSALATMTIAGLALPVTTAGAAATPSGQATVRDAATVPATTAAAGRSVGLAGGWSVNPSPNRGTGESELFGVSCVSASACTAVGSSGRYGEKTLVESWNGTQWRVVPSPNRSKYNALGGVSCVSASACTAVGWHGPGAPTGPSTLVESWNGATWSVVPSPNPVAGGGGILSGVSCVSASACTAVGTADGGTLVESWNGATWSVVPSPNPAPGGALYNNVLDEVSCVSSSACTAVGDYVKGSFVKTLVESWNGTAWSVVPSRNPGDKDSVLSGVSCVSASTCTAVGDYGQGPFGKTLVESWNGTRWSVVPSPNPARGHNYLFAVSCVSASACTATGTHGNRDPFRGTLVESWNGATWSVMPSPNKGTAQNRLQGVSCVSATACTAAGYYLNSGPGFSKTLIESSNGAAKPR